MAHIPELLTFGSAGCVGCKVAREDLPEGRYILCEEEPEMVERYGIQSVPTTKYGEIQGHE